MATLTMTFSFSAGSIQIQGSVSREVSSQIGHDPILPAAQAGTLTTRTDDDTGIITLSGGIAPTPDVNDRVTVFWTNTDGTKGYRYNMTVTGVSGDTISVDLGAGDVLPALNKEVTVGEEVAIDTDLDGDLVELFGANCSSTEDMMFRVDELVGTDTTPIFVHLIPSGEAIAFDIEGIFANPFAAVNIGAVVFARGGTGTGDVRGNVAFGYDGIIP